MKTTPASPGLFQQRWNEQIHRDEHGAPLLSPLFVVGLGAAVSLVDLRDATEATAPLGYVPGSIFLSAEAVARDLSPDQSVVLVSRTGADAARVALELEATGRPSVAAMAGGLIAWRELGLKTTRDPAGVRTRPYPRADASEPEPGVPFSRDDVERHLGDPRNVRWIKLAAMMSHAHFSCVDGRDERGVVGTPGGDAGEFLLSLASLERVGCAPLDEGDVAAAFHAHVEAFGAFYLHSDVLTFQSLAESLAADPRLASAADRLGDPWKLRELFRHPDPRLRDPLLEHLLQPEGLGCGHLRLMLQHSDEYGLRRDLIVHFLRAFFREWWSGDPDLRFMVLPGEHQEAAVLNIRLDQEVWGPVPIPLVSPASGSRQMFVHHPGVTAYMRSSLVRFHLAGMGTVPLVRGAAERLEGTFTELGERQMAATLGRLAGGLPVYDVAFRRDGSFTVQER